MPTLNADALKAALWDTLGRVKDGDMLPSHADAIASQAREILRTVKIELQIASQSKSPVPPSVKSFSGGTVQTMPARRAG